eukprot:gene28126-37022_t
MTEANSFVDDRKASSTNRNGEEKFQLNETRKTESSKDLKQSILGTENLLTAFFSIVLIAITLITYPPDIWDSSATVTSQHVWYFGWITAISTGVGVLPFFLISEPEKYWIGASNALAAGMMIAASFSLVFEGSQVTQVNYGWLAQLKVGFIIGMSFVVLTKNILNHFQGVDSTDINPANLKKMILILFVMTLHSLSEGIGIGVSFGGKKRFAPMLPGGLGFAAGAMTYVALFELLVEAVEETSLITTALVSGASCFLMFSIQNAVKMGI